MAVWRGNAMRVVEVGPERAVVELPAHPGLYTPHGYIHAGVMLALAATRVTGGDGRLLALVNSTHYARPRPAWPATRPVAESLPPGRKV